MISFEFIYKQSENNRMWLANNSAKFVNMEMDDSQTLSIIYPTLILIVLHFTSYYLLLYTTLKHTPLALFEIYTLEYLQTYETQYSAMA